jgi:hypothetical protein
MEFLHALKQYQVSWSNVYMVIFVMFLG